MPKSSGSMMASRFVAMASVLAAGVLTIVGAIRSVTFFTTSQTSEANPLILVLMDATRLGGSSRLNAHRSLWTIVQGRTCHQFDPA